MESALGQVRPFNPMEKFKNLVQKTNEEKEKHQNTKMFLSELLQAKSEYEDIRQNLNLITDSDAKEYCIYRLKAAELNFNRYLKLAKSMGLTAAIFSEESL